MKTPTIMTTADYIHRAHVQGKLHARPSAYLALIDRISAETNPDLTPQETILALDLVDAQIIGFETTPVYAEEPSHYYAETAEPIRHERRYYVQRFRMIKINLEDPACPGCAENAAEVKRLRTRVAELEELLQEKQGSRLAAVG
jgi:hypothetical protein